MPKVSYNGNGNTGGSVPVDNTSYAAGGLGSTWLMNGTPTRWLNTSLPASNPASTEFDANSQFGGPSTGTHYGSRRRSCCTARRGLDRAVSRVTRMDFRLFY